jgi:outer membrane protein OmpA-like peptidoglycan-associated protein
LNSFAIDARFIFSFSPMNGCETRERLFVCIILAAPIIIRRWKMYKKNFVTALAAATILCTPAMALASKRDDARSMLAAVQAKIDLTEKNGVTGDAADVQARARKALQAAQFEFGKHHEDAAMDAAHQADVLADHAASLQHEQAIAAARAHQAQSDAAVSAQQQAAASQEQAAASQAQAEQAQAAANHARAEAAQAKSQLADLQMKQTALGATLVLQDVVFETGKADLKPGADARLQPLAQYLQANPAVKVRIDGHTDSQGSAAMNQQLSQARADSVRAALSGMGVDGSRIDAVGHGQSQPVASNANAAGRQQNRRVEVTLVGQQASNLAAN